MFQPSEDQPETIVQQHHDAALIADVRRYLEYYYNAC